MHSRSWDRASVALAGFLVSGASVSAADQAPVWTRVFAGGIEWCRSAGDTSAPRLLVCDREGRVHVLDTSTGGDLFERPAVVNRGAVPAGSTADRAYLYDRNSAYCLSLKETATGVGVISGNSAGGLIWRSGDIPAATAAHDGDPEFLSRLVAATTLPEGLAVVRSDGECTVLDRVHGTPGRVWRFGKIANASLHFWSGRLGLMAKTGARSSLWTWTPGRDVLPQRTDIDKSTPAVAATVGAQLVAIWPDEILIFSEGQILQRVAAGNGRFMAATLSADPAEIESTAGPVDKPFWIGKDNGDLVRVLVPSGAVTKLSTGTTAPIIALSVCGESVAGTDGERLALSSGGEHPLVVPLKAGRRVVGVYATTDRAYALIEAGEDGHRLLAVPRQRQGSQSRPAAGSVFETGGIRLRESSGVRDAIWLQDRLIVVEPTMLRAYALPR